MFRGQLLVLAVPCVDPDLDDVDLVRRELLHRLAAFRLGRNPVGHGGAPRFGHRDPAPCTEKPRGTGNRLAAHIEEFVVVRAKTQRGAHAVVGAQSQVPYERVARRAEMDVRVDQHRHHGLAGEIHARGARRHAHVGRLADLGDSCALHDQCRVLDHASVADDQPRAFERGDGLRGRRYRASGKETKGNDCCNCDHIHSVHGSLHHAVCALTIA